MFIYRLHEIIIHRCAVKCGGVCEHERYDDGDASQQQNPRQSLQLTFEKVSIRPVKCFYEPIGFYAIQHKLTGFGENVFCEIL